MKSKDAPLEHSTCLYISACRYVAIVKRVDGKFLIDTLMFNAMPNPAD